MEKELIALFGSDYIAELARRSNALSYNQFYYVLKQRNKDKGMRVSIEVNKLIRERKAEMKKLIAQ